MVAAHVHAKNSWNGECPISSWYYMTKNLSKSNHIGLLLCKKVMSRYRWDSVPNGFVFALQFQSSWGYSWFKAGQMVYNGLIFVSLIVLILMKLITMLNLINNNPFASWIHYNCLFYWNNQLLWDGLALTIHVWHYWYTCKIIKSSL